MEIITLRGHHLKNLYRYFFDDTGKRMDDLQTRLDYGIIFSEHIKNLFQKISKNQDILIRVTDTLDDICKKCTRKSSTCERPSPKEDLIIIDFYGLEKDKIYAARNLLNTLKTVENSFSRHT